MATDAAAAAHHRPLRAMSGVRSWDRSSAGDRPPVAERPVMGGPTSGTGTERLTAGRATVAVAPIVDPERLPELVAALASVPGVARAELDALEDGEALLTVTVAHPLLLAQEIGRALRGRIRSCTPAGPGGRIVVDARPPVAPPPPAPEEPDADAPEDAEDDGELLEIDPADGHDAEDDGAHDADDAPEVVEDAQDAAEPPLEAAPDADAPSARPADDAPPAARPDWNTRIRDPAGPGFGPGPGPRSRPTGPTGPRTGPRGPSSGGSVPGGARWGGPLPGDGPSTGPGGAAGGPTSEPPPGAPSGGAGAPADALRPDDAGTGRPEPEPDPGPERGWRARARRTPWGARAGRGAQDDRAGDTPGGPGAGDSARRGPSAGPRAAAPEPPDPRVVAAALGGAIDDTPGLSVLVFDRELRVRAVAGVDPSTADGSLLLGRPVVHAFPIAARRPLAAALTSALEGTERTVLLPDAEGEERLEATCRPAGAGLPGGVCVVRDLELLGGGTLLVEAQRAFEITFRHSPIGQGLLSRTGRWLRVNGALAELLGRPEEELVGAEAVDAMHPEDRAEERERLIGLVEGAEDHYVVGTRFLHVDGHVVRTHTRMTRIADEDGLTRGFVAQVVDAAAWRRFRAG